MPREKIGPSAPRNRYTRAREAIEEVRPLPALSPGREARRANLLSPARPIDYPGFVLQSALLPSPSRRFAGCALPSTRQTTSIAAAKKAATCLGQIGLAFTVRTVVIFGTRNAEVHGLLNAYMIANE
jgi:hypothetical protein